MEKNKALICDGDKVILKSLQTDTLYKDITVRENRVYWLSKLKFNITGAIGAPYGSTFEVQGDGSVVRVAQEREGGTDQESMTNRDNRNLIDRDANQKLGREEIEAMKKQGVSGTSIVKQLIENSATFQEKTEFAQVKYIKKKKKKHIKRFTVLKPSGRLVTEMYFNKCRPKICYLRKDALAQMMVYGNVHAHCRLMVVDSCCGLLLGTMMERMGGYGKIIQLFVESHPIRTAAQCFGFPEEFWDNVVRFPLNRLALLKKETESSGERCDSTVSEKESEPPSKKTKSDSSAESPQAEASSQSRPIEEAAAGQSGLQSEGSTQNEGSKGKPEKTKRQEKTDSKLKVQKIEEEAKQLITGGNLDGLLMACRVHPTPIVMNLLEYIAPSRPIVVFSTNMEPLMDCYMNLRDRGGIANLRLTETWLRNYQVLPDRTHPEINMSNDGGYLLTGITVEPAPTGQNS